MRQNTIRKILLGGALLFAVAAPLLAQEAESATNEIEKASFPTKTFLADEFGAVGECELGARLDNLVMMLQNSPDATAHIIVYNGQDVLPSNYGSERFATRMRNRLTNYLTTTRGVAPERFVIVNGGFRKSQTTAMWVVPKNAAPPQPCRSVAPPELPTGKTYLFNQLYFYETSEDFLLPSQTAKTEAVEEIAAPDETANQTEDEAANERELSPEEQEELKFWWVKDNFAAAVKREKGSRGLIIYYADDQTFDTNKIYQHLFEGISKLSANARMSMSDFEIVFGGYRDNFECEMWIVPAKGKMPKLAPAERPMPEPETSEIENSL